MYVIEFEGLNFVKAVGVVEGWKRQQRYVERVIASPGQDPMTARLCITFCDGTSDTQVESTLTGLRAYMTKRGFTERKQS